MDKVWVQVNKSKVAAILWATKSVHIGTHHHICSIIMYCHKIQKCAISHPYVMYHIVSVCLVDLHLVLMWKIRKLILYHITSCHIFSAVTLVMFVRFLNDVEKVKQLSNHDLTAADFIYVHLPNGTPCRIESMYTLIQK